MRELMPTRKLIIIFSVIYIWNYQFLDFLFFSAFNGHLLFMPWTYQYIFALLNHRYENFMDVLLVIGSIGWVLNRHPESRKYSLAFIICAIFWYEMGFQIVHYLESLPMIAKHSPSLEHALYVDLSKLHPLAKVYAQHSFPSGHAMIFGYFGSIARSMFPSPLKQRFFKLSILCCIPRLVAGAHAVSDILAGYSAGMFLWATFCSLASILKHIQRKALSQSIDSKELQQSFTYSD